MVHSALELLNRICEVVSDESVVRQPAVSNCSIEL